jgi:hypothetical protein
MHLVNSFLWNFFSVVFGNIAHYTKEEEEEALHLHSLLTLFYLNHHHAFVYCHSLLCHDRWGGCRVFQWNQGTILFLTVQQKMFYDSLIGITIHSPSLTDMTDSHLSSHFTAFVCVCVPLRFVTMPFTTTTKAHFLIHIWPWRTYQTPSHGVMSMVSVIWPSHSIRYSTMRMINASTSGSFT